MEKQLLVLEEESEAVTIQEEIQLKKQELKSIHEMFEKANGRSHPLFSARTGSHTINNRLIS
ncbi:YgaB family protein [Peribacillus frigoritolerans]|nr:YgaB family protein [Peribacillus frigoritolerans]